MRRHEARLKWPHTRRTLPITGTANDGGQKISSGQIGQIIGNGLIQTVANSSTIWRVAKPEVFEASPVLKFY